MQLAPWSCKSASQFTCQLPSISSSSSACKSASQFTCNSSWSSPGIQLCRSCMRRYRLRSPGVHLLYKGLTEVRREANSTTTHTKRAEKVQANARQPTLNAPCLLCNPGEEWAKVCEECVLLCRQSARKVPRLLRRIAHHARHGGHKCPAMLTTEQGWTRTFAFNLS